MLEANFQITLYKILITLFVFLYSIKLSCYKKNVNTLFGFGVVFVTLFCAFFIGVRDWTDEACFVDSIRYGYSYLYDYYDFDLSEAKDIGFYCFTFIIKSLGCSVYLYFFICSLFYVLPLLFFVKRLRVSNELLFLLMIVCSMSFYDYGVNVVRNGIASSFLLLSFTYYNKKLYYVLFAIIAILFHKSMLIPALVFFIIMFYNRPKIFLLFWPISIILNLLFSNYIRGFVISLDLLDDRSLRYFESEAEIGTFSRVGFRWDFILYSLVPIIIGFFYYFKLKISSNFYLLLLSTYTLMNGIWVLINDVPYSNRFAYLSWFLMPIIIMYPIYKNEPGKIQGLILFIYLIFTLLI